MIQAAWTRGVRKEISMTKNGAEVTEQIVSLTYTDDINGDTGAVKLGSACAARLEFTVEAPAGTWTGAEIVVSVGGVPLGSFTVTGTREREGRLAVTAEDAMAGGAMKEYFEPPASSGTALGIVREIAAGAGLALADLSGIADVAVSGLSVGCTRRQMLGRMAAVLGRNAHIDRYGRLCLRWYENGGMTAGPEDWYAGGMERQDADYAIRRIECSVTRLTDITEDGTTTEQTETTVLEAGTGNMGISLDCPYMTQSILNGIYTRIGGFAFRPMTLELYGDCRIETGDILTVTDAEGRVYTVPVMTVSHTWDGGVRTTVSAAGESGETLGGEVRGTLSQAVTRLQAELARFRNLEAENITVLRGRITQLFADWAQIGEAVIDTLEAEGINADWINAGALTVRDSSERTVFHADADTGEVDIGGATVTYDGILTGDGSGLYTKMGNGRLTLSGSVFGPEIGNGYDGVILRLPAPAAGSDSLFRVTAGIMANPPLQVHFFRNGSETEGFVQMYGDVFIEDTYSGTTVNLLDLIRGKVGKTGDTMTGALVVQSTNIWDGSTPDSDAYGRGMTFRDAAGSFALGYIEPVSYANGRQGTLISNRKTIGGTETSNYFYIGFDENDSPYIGMSNPAAWRSAMGLAAAHYDSGWRNYPLSSAFSNYDADNVLKYRRIGNVVELVGQIKPTAQIASGDTATIGTLPSGFRPSEGTYSIQQGSTKNTWLLYINSSGTCIFSRYGTNTYAAAPATAWLPLHAIFTTTNAIPT